MFVPAPIDREYVPYTKRRALKRNAGLFVDGSAASSGGARVVLQDAQCAGKADGTPCGYYPGMICCGEECNFPQNCG